MSTEAAVIVYHGVGDCPPAQDPYRLFMPIEKFARQMEFLARHRRVVPLEDVVSGRVGKGRRAVAVTFDDGYCSVLDEAVPVLQRYGFPAVCFVPTRWIGDANGWDTFKPTDRALPILSADGLVELEAAGVKVESHGHAHIPLGEVDEQDAITDVAASRRILTEVLGREPRFLAYPYGSQSPDARRAVEGCRFDCAFSIGQRDVGRFGRERVTIRPADNMALYAFKTSGRYLAVRESQWGDRAFSLIRPLVHARRAKGA
ncbi:MAG TPA: polysaccharide deacetylase family protein [Acidimicrobiia bacterium]